MICLREQTSIVNLGIARQLEQRVSKNNYLYTDAIIENVKGILGLDFYGILRFVEKEIFEFNENKCTILIPRRCLLLVEWFIGYLINHKNKVNGTNIIEYAKDDIFPFICVNGKKNYIISEKSDISLLCNKIEKITILDDICIHGISISKTAERIRGIIENSVEENNIEVETCVYMYSKETIKEIPNRFYKVSLRAEWLKLSTKIIDFINYLNLPYVSYLNSYTIPNCDENSFKNLLKRLLENKNLICEEFNKENNSNEKFSYFLIEKKISSNENELMKCVRIYYNKNIKTICFLPYVILKSIENFKLDEVFKLFSSYITLDEKIENAISDKKVDYIYSFLSYIASQAYWLEICKKFKDIAEVSNSKEVVQDNMGCLEKLFGSTMLAMIKENNFKVNNLKKSNNSITINFELFKELFEVAADDIEKVCIDSWLEFEQLELQKQIGRNNFGYKRLENVLIDNYFKLEDKEKANKLNKKVVEFETYKYACFLKILNYCDQGKLNITCLPDQGASYLKAGELGCLCVNKKIFNKDYSFYMRTLLSHSYYRYLFI